MSGRRLFHSMQSVISLITLVAFVALLSGPTDAQQPAQVPDSQANDPSGQKAPPAATAQPAKGTTTSPKPAAPGEGIPALVADADQMQGLLGRQVRSSTGEDMGRIIDVVIDRTARVRAAVIDFGGFLGVGSRQIAVAWNAIRVSDQGRPPALVVDFTRDQLRVAPTYKAGEQVVLVGQADVPAESANGATTKDAPKQTPSK